MEFHLDYGSSSIPVTIPSKNLASFLEPKEVEGVLDPHQEVVRALKNPIGSKTLKELVSSDDKVVILASDITRPSPSHLLLPPLLDVLNEAGVKDEQIRLIFGLGIHRGQSEEEKIQLLSPQVYQRIECKDHDLEDCVEIGYTERKTPIQVSREVLKADTLIATGNLEFHYFAGFSGGAKALCPGVCGRETIKANHRLSMERGASGGRMEGNPVREDIEEIGRIVGIDFMVNAILNRKKEVVKVVAGDVEKAHGAGTSSIREIFGLHLDSLADIVITTPGGLPKDINLYQSHKALENASLAVKDGGIILLLAQCRDGLGEDLFAEPFLEGLTPEELIEELKEDFILGRHKASRIAGIHKRSQIFMVSDLVEEIRDRLFFPSFDTPNHALTEAFRVRGEDARVLVMPYGISTLPIL